MDYDDLVTRLRGDSDANTAFLLCYEAADAIQSLRERVGDLARTLNDHLLSESAETRRADQAQAELAAARALLKEAKRIGGIGTASEWCLLCERIDAALAGEKK